MKKPLFYFLIILAVSTAIRLLLIEQPLLEFFPQRQTQTAEITRNIYKNGWPDFWTPKVRYFTGQPIPYVLEFPLYNGIVAAFYHLFGPNVTWGRIVSLIFFTLSGIVFYRLVQSTINNQQLTIFALLFFTFSPLHILVSRSFQPEELTLFLILLAVYRQSWLVLSLATLTKLPAILFAPLLIYQNRIQGKTWIKIILQLFLATVPIIIWSIRGRELTTDPLISGNYQLNNWFQPYLIFDLRWYVSLFQIEQTLVLTAIGLVFFWIGLLRKFNTKFDLWSLWLLCGIIYAIIFTNHIMVHEYYHIFLIPALSFFVASGLLSVWKINVSDKKPIQFIFRTGIILIFTAGLLLPFVKRILSAPKTPTESSEVAEQRYNYITDF